ncbi:DNA-3-methyladenine glycosylase 2 family protein [Kroppenstedtia pulmonis]|uniref:DNA-3-methyladenine glycosylase II n=1 Tax=Kroppenstedtia pulmonis TaxID=1380685 RepID=A0A7D4CK56_9BACL|nr:DNA-3-methyladenine glycosylase [Kroppenstedtia pulmonis]QKG83418.1 DNA-3-methyladenine glycosylase 2 family protein [Kroppenstedtia pulmonis]
METLELHPVWPYSFQQTGKRLIHFEKTAYRYQNGMLYRALRINQKPLVVGFSWEDGQEPVMKLHVDRDLSDRDRDKLKKTVRQMFTMDVNLAPFYEQMKKDNRLAPIIEERRGLHMVLDSDLYECLMKTIIGQQLNVSFAAKLVDRFVKVAGDTIESQGEQYSVFPSPEQVAMLQYEDLQALQFNRRKAEYIIDISRKVVEGTLNLESLVRLDDEEFIQKLCALRGVGRWTAECLLLFGMGRQNLLPAADIGLRNALQKVYALPAQPSEDEVRKTGQAWSPWSSYVTFYLWDYLTETK